MTEFDPAFRDKLARLIAWRRDVRRFEERAVPAEMIENLLDVAQLSPSVGNSQPWRWVRVDGTAARRDIRANFVAGNAAAQAAQGDERAASYAALKLAGLDRAPVQFAVFCDEATEQGHGLGRHTMPEMLAYSTVGMITAFWLAARAVGLGVGWVSILDPIAVGRVLEVPSDWTLIAYLCVGWPESAHLDPELARFGWQQRTAIGRQVMVR